MTLRMTSRTCRGWSLAFAGSFVLFIVATLPPFLGTELRGIVMFAFSGVCHQIAERSPHLHDVQLAVCHRCYGIYLALPIAALAFPFARRWDERLNGPAPVLLGAAVAVPGIDWLGDVLGLWSNTAISRLATGAVFGLVAGYFLSRALSGLLDEGEAGAIRSAASLESEAVVKSGPDRYLPPDSYSD